MYCPDALERAELEGRLKELQEHEAWMRRQLDRTPPWIKGLGLAGWFFFVAPILGAAGFIDTTQDVFGVLVLAFALNESWWEWCENDWQKRIDRWTLDKR